MKKVIAVLSLVATVGVAVAQNSFSNNTTKATPVMKVDQQPAAASSVKDGEEAKPACCQKGAAQGKACCEAKGKKKHSKDCHGQQAGACCQKGAAPAGSCQHHGEGKEGEHHEGEMKKKD
jgi:hypothetical protein